MAGGEAAGAATGLAGTILAWQNKFHIELQSAAKALKTSGSAFWTLAGASFAYGVFHAAGPGHGKAVLASYMIASETALRRGMILAALAALLQGCVAIALVGAAAALLGATAMQMKAATNAIELASYGAIALLGAGLVWKKGWAFLAALRAPPDVVVSRGGFYCEAVTDPSHVHSSSCGHLHAVDPTTLERDFSWRGALGAVVAAGLRPCSGAILILVFTLAQGMFWAGAGAVLLMSAGTAVTTGALAACAVFARQKARRWSGPGGRWASLAGRGAELLAAALVMGLGLTLLTAASLNAGA
jgi:ABC-type nickel/cobalt efflux system permease component RcnA